MAPSYASAEDFALALGAREGPHCVYRHKEKRKLVFSIPPRRSPLSAPATRSGRTGGWFQLGSGSGSGGAGLLGRPPPAPPAPPARPDPRRPGGWGGRTAPLKAGVGATAPETDLVRTLRKRFPLNPPPPPRPLLRGGGVGRGQEEPALGATRPQSTDGNTGEGSFLLRNRRLVN